MLLLLCLSAKEGWGQLDITQANTVYTINFDDTVAGVNVGQFEGSGFTPTPVGGELNSGAWRVHLSNTYNFDFGDKRDTVPSFFARTNSSGGVTDGGIWAFEVNSNNYALGIQPSGAAFTPGHIVLKIQNNTGCVVTSIDVDYKVYIFNDQDRANSFNFSYSDDDLNYTNVTALNLVSPEPMDNPASWVANSKSTTLTGLEIPPGSSFYLRWTGADVSGSGSRDEFALDDIVVIVYSDRDVSNLGTSLSCNDRAFVEWENPVSGTCWDEVLIIASSSGAITAVPTGDGAAYIANDTFGLGTEIATGEFVVFKGTEEDFVLHGLSTDSTYHLKAYTRWGTNWYDGDVHQFFVDEYCYRSALSGDWTSNATWEQYDGSQWVANIGHPSAYWHNAIVRGNHNVVVNNSPLSCGNLSIEVDGQVYNGSSNNRFINIGGDLVCEGVFGSDSGSIDRLGINFNYALHNVSGNGSLDGLRIRKEENSSIPTLLIIDTDITLRWNGLAIYSDCSSCEFNVVVNSGATVYIAGNSNGPGILTLSPLGGSGFGTLTVHGVVETYEFRPYNRILSTQSKYVVHSGGKILVNGEVSLSDSTSNIPRRDSVIVQSDGEIEFVKADTVFINPYNDGAPLSRWILNAASTAYYSSTSSQIVESGLQYGHLKLESSGTKSLNGNTLVRGNLSIADGVDLDVTSSNHEITLWGHWYNQNLLTSGFLPHGGRVNLHGTTSQQVMSGAGQTFNLLELDNPAGAALQTTANVADELVLVSGILDIGMHDLDVRSASITGAFGTGTFIKADDLGYVVATVSTVPKEIPTGRNPYLPITLSCGSCPGTEVNIRLKQGHDENPDIYPPVYFTSNVIDAQWEAFALDDIPDFTLTLGWPSSEHLQGFSPAETFIRSWQSGISTQWLNQLPATPASGSIPGPYSRSWIISSLPTGNHFFGVGGNALLLSNTSLTLTASPGLAGIHLTWQAGEVPETGSYWIVERHTGTGNWEAITELHASGIKGEWLDARPGFGHNYYRIALLGPEGSRTWSNIASARWERQGNWHIGPNPASTHLNITASELGEGALSIVLYHASGAQAWEVQAGHGPTLQEQMSLSGLAPGVYVLVVSRGSEPVLRERIVIQR